MPLYMLLEQRLLIKRTDTHRTPKPILLVHHHMLIEMRQLQEFLFAYLTLERIATAMGSHVLLQLGLLFERFLRALGAIEMRETAVEQKMLIERRDLSETTGTLIADVLLDFVVGFHVIVEVGDLSEIK